MMSGSGGTPNLPKGQADYAKTVADVVAPTDEFMKPPEAGYSG